MGEDNKVMNPHHPKWKEFEKLLNDALGYHEYEVKPGDSLDPGHEWDEYGDLRLSFVTEVLDRMDCCDVEASIAYYRQQGARSDWEVLIYTDYYENYAVSKDAPVTDAEIEAFEAAQLEEEN
jgi:hypothetical protein